MLAESTGHEPGVLTDAAKDAIRDQLGRLLANPFFSHSKRFPTFLRFVVDQTLAGEAENIKERTLGIEIFGRDADYDTASDPIVRVTAAEIRKRVAQYYQDPAHVDELRITLQSGSYIPQFHWPRGSELGLAETDHGAARAAEPGAARRVMPSRRHLRLTLALVCISIASLSLAGILGWRELHRTAFNFFWQPVLSSGDPVLVSVADQMEYSEIALRDAAEPSHQVLLKDNLTAIVIDDLNATVKVAGVLESSGKQYTLKGEGATNLDDLRHGPTVFVGAFDNAWTLRLTNPLRFHFANDADMTHLSIVDTATHGQPRWVVDRSVQLATNNYRDYAIVARFTDTNTGKLAVVVAGIGRGGTRVAGEFLTDPNDLAQLKRAAQAAGDKKNFEVVLSTQIIEGEPGTPKMEAVYFW